MLALYSLDHNPTLYALAADNAREAQAHALERRRALPALLERRDPAHRRRPAGQPADQAATTSLFAWLAVYPPPAS